jgi:hypothetical protein
MAIYRPAENAEIIEKKPEQGELVQAVQQKTYTQEEVLAMLEQIQKGQEK